METKPGYKTTEFWGTVGVNIGGLLAVTGAWDFISNWHAGLLVTVANGAYALSRGIAKANVKPDPTS